VDIIPNLRKQTSKGEKQNIKLENRIYFVSLSKLIYVRKHFSYQFINTFASKKKNSIYQYVRYSPLLFLYTQLN